MGVPCLLAGLQVLHAPHDVLGELVPQQGGPAGTLQHGLALLLRITWTDEVGMA